MTISHARGLRLAARCHKLEKRYHCPSIVPKLEIFFIFGGGHSGGGGDSGIRGRQQHDIDSSNVVDQPTLEVS